MYYQKDGIQRHKTVTYTPQHNGLVERMNKTILERVRCLLLSAKLPKSFWGEAVHTTAYLINRSPSATLDFKVPEEVWTYVAPNYNHLRVFGCVAYAHTRQGKLDARAKKCMFIGYSDGVKDYKLWFFKGNMSKVIISRDVVFRESKMYMTEGKESNEQSSNNKGVSEQVELELPKRSICQDNEIGGVDQE